MSIRVAKKGERMNKKHFFMKRYLAFGIGFISAFFAFILTGVILTVIFPKDIAPEMGITAGAIIGAIVWSLPTSYSFVCMFVYGKRAMYADTVNGTVTSFSSLKYLVTARLSVKTERGEYYTPSFFSRGEAKKLVGKKVSLYVINDTALITEIK